MLNFISTGSAFNVELGNNSAYLKTGNTLILFDCGSSIFSSLVKKGLLGNVQNMFIVVTHTHPDHIGSLGDLILYNHHFIFAAIEIIYKDAEIVERILTAMGVNRDYYKFQSPAGSQFSINNNDFHLDFTIYDVQHSPRVFSYGYTVKNMQGSDSFYYSGDTSGIPGAVMQAFREGRIDLIYQDVSSFDAEGNPHLSFGQLVQLIPVDLRSRVYCMHLDANFDTAAAQQLGFKVAQALN